ncbi:MAG: HNH endonuclease [Candidatus Humimicrobiaceae bacterium]
MPYRPKIPCKHSGCPNLINPGETYCDKHKVQSSKDYRINRPDDSFYSTYKWKQLRDQVLIEEPSCRECNQPSKVADHIVPREWGGSDERENLQGLCKRCHNKKIMLENKKSGKIN